MKRFVLIALLLVSAANINAQDGRLRDKRQQIKSLKVAFITDALKLTPSEAEKFWPVYDAYDSKQTELRQRKATRYLNRRNSATGVLNEKDALALLQQIEQNQDESYQNRKKFLASLRTVLPAAKIVQLLQSEEDFNRKLLKQYRERRKSAGQ